MLDYKKYNRPYISICGHPKLETILIFSVRDGHNDLLFSQNKFRFSVKYLKSNESIRL